MTITNGTAVTSWNTDIDAQPCVPAVLLALFGELAGDDGRRGLGEDRADHEGRRQRQPAGPADQHHRQRRQRHLRRAQAKHQMAQRVDLGQREVQADDEEQKDDAELGQGLQRQRIDHRPCGVRPEDHADQQIAQLEGRRNRRNASTTVTALPSSSRVWTKGWPLIIGQPRQMSGPWVARAEASRVPPQAGIQPKRRSTSFSSSSTTSTPTPTATISSPVLSGSAVLAKNSCMNGA